MKKVFLAFLSLAVFAACDNEPVDSTIIGGENPELGVYDLSKYHLILNTTVPLFGNIIVDTEFTFGTNNTAQSALVETTAFGEVITENVIYNRNSEGLVTGFTSSSAGMTTNQTTVTYTDNKISKIVYVYTEDAEENYTYNFTYEGSNITRTQPASNITTVFTLDSQDRLIKKESFEGQTSILKEVVTYSPEGNCTTSVITGEESSTQSFSFDTNVNPLKSAFADQYLLNFLNDDYEDNIGTNLAQFFSTNNWNKITTEEGTTNFDLTYDNLNRIESRASNYGLGEEASVGISESFELAN